MQRLGFKSGTARFGFEGWICVLIASVPSVPGLCILFSEIVTTSDGYRPRYVSCAHFLLYFPSFLALVLGLEK